MKILFVCHRFPYPPRRGGKIRPFNIIRHLSRDHEVHVASLVRSESEARDGAGLAEHCARYYMGRVRESVQALRMVARLPSTQPSTLGYFRSEALARDIRQAVMRERFDLIFVHCSSVAQYVEDVTGVPKILDFGDMDSQKWREYARYKPFPLSLGYALEAVKLEREERRLARRFDLCTATTRAERQTLDGYRTGVRSDWFPNGVDSNYFAPSAEAPEPDTLAFVGRMDYYPNQECMLDFCKVTLPLLRSARPRVKLMIIGADPSREIRELATIDGVTVTGSVPDVRPLLRRAAVMVAPLNIARGTQNKLLEAMAMGIPVVTSRIAAAGVDAREGEDLLTATSPAEYAAVIERVLASPAERERLSAAGRARMLSHHSWEGSMRRLDGIIGRVVTSGRQAALRVA